MAQQGTAQAQGPRPAHTTRLELNRWLPHAAPLPPGKQNQVLPGSNTTPRPVWA